MINLHIKIGLAVWNDEFSNHCFPPPHQGNCLKASCVTTAGQHWDFSVTLKQTLPQFQTRNFPSSSCNGKQQPHHKQDSQSFCHLSFLTQLVLLLSCFCEGASLPWSWLATKSQRFCHLHWFHLSVLEQAVAVLRVKFPPCLMPKSIRRALRYSSAF